MESLIQKFKKLTLNRKSVSPVTGKELEDGVEENWLGVAKQVRKKIGMKPVEVEQAVTNPEKFLDVGQGCSKGQMPALLMKTIQDIDRDRIFGKTLALEHIIKRKQAGPDQPLQAYPVTTSVKRTPLRSSTPGQPGGVHVEESRPYNQTEISEIRTQYAQRGSKDAEFLVKLWEKGADTIILATREMKTLKNIVENPTVLESLETILDRSPNENHTLLDWVTAAWRFAFPTLDLTTLEGQAKWTNWDDAMKICKKLGILYHVYHNVPTPLAAPMLPAFRKILIKGAPPHLKVSLISPLQTVQTLQQAVDCLKDLKNLEGDRVYTFSLQQKKKLAIKRQEERSQPRQKGFRFPKFRPFGNPYRMNIRPQGTNQGMARFIGKPMTPFPRKPFLGQGTPQGTGKIKMSNGRPFNKRAQTIKRNFHIRPYPSRQM